MRWTRLLLAAGHGHGGARPKEFGGVATSPCLVLCVNDGDYASSLLLHQLQRPSLHDFDASRFLPPYVNPTHKALATFLGTTMWFWIFYRAREDGPVVIGLRKPWDGHGHGHGGDEEEHHAH